MFVGVFDERIKVTSADTWEDEITVTDPLDPARRGWVYVYRSATLIETVTEDYVDAQARLASMEAARDRLRQIMAEAKTTEDLLRAEQQLTQREADIERARAVDVANRTAVTVQTHQLGSCGMRKSFMPTPSNANRR